MTFYLKYRPQTIDEIDITSVRVTLTNILKPNEIPHALLFAGPRGTGKTSTARIVAKAINCEGKEDKPCNKCDQCLSITNGNNIDVIEMDAASNRGIDDIRVLRDGVKLSPANSNAKVYIIDEAHMLTTEASNALLKTLEEPPAHVYFMLATTNPEKLIETIKSRTTLVSFTKATDDEIKRSLKRVVSAEKIKISDEELLKIASISKGSFRDAVKNLEQYSKDENFLSSVRSFDAEKFVKDLLSKDLNKALSDFDTAIKNGINVDNVVNETLEVLQNEMLKSSDKNVVYLIELILKYQEYNKVSPIEELPLQMAISKWCDSESSSSETPVVEEKTEKTKTIEKVRVVSEISSVIKTDTIKEIIDVVKVDAEKPAKREPLEMLDSYSWNKVLEEVRPINATIEGLLRTTKPLGFEGNNLRIGVSYKFHKDKLEETKTKQMLEEIAFKIFAKNIRIECFVQDAPIKLELTNSETKNIMTTAEEMFS